MKKPDSAELPRAMQTLIERLRERDRLRVFAAESPSPEAEQILRDLSDTVIQDCLILIGKLLPLDLKKDYARELAGRARGRPKPPRRNPKLTKWVLENAGTGTPGELQARLDLMTGKDRKKKIGQDWLTKSPSLSTIKDILTPPK